MYRDDWGVIFPEPNIPLMTWRICRTLAASRERPPYPASDGFTAAADPRTLFAPALIYHATQRLLSLLPPFSLDLPIARKRHDPGTAEPTPWLPSDPDSGSDAGSGSGSDTGAARSPYPRPPRKQWRWKKAASLTGGGVGQLPEAMLAAAVVVVLKLVYALDREEGGSRDAAVAGRLAGVLPGKAEWLRAVKEGGEVADGVGDLGRLWKGEVDEMTGQDVDDYLDFVERAIVPPTKLPKRMAEVDRHFPAPATRPAADHAPGRAPHRSTLSGVIEGLFETLRTPVPASALAPDSPPASTPPPAPPAAHVAHFAATPYETSALTLLPFPPELHAILTAAAGPIGLTPYSLSNPVGAIEHLLGLREQAAEAAAAPGRVEDARRAREGEEERRREWQRVARELRRGRDKEELDRRRRLGKGKKGGMPRGRMPGAEGEEASGKEGEAGEEEVRVVDRKWKVRSEPMIVDSDDEVQADQAMVLD